MTCWSIRAYSLRFAAGSEVSEAAQEAQTTRNGGPMSEYCVRYSAFTTSQRPGRPAAGEKVKRGTEDWLPRSLSAGTKLATWSPIPKTTQVPLIFS